MALNPSEPLEPLIGEHKVRGEKCWPPKIERTKSQILQITSVVSLFLV
jgi:hypothetical protein